MTILNRLTFQNEFYFNKHGIKFITFCPSSTNTNFVRDFASRMIDTDALAATKSVTVKRHAVQT